MKTEQKMCEKHKRLFANNGHIGIACLIDRGKENEVADRLNVLRFTTSEIRQMSYGIMPIRHFIREDYCEIIPFSYRENEMAKKLIS